MRVIKSSVFWNLYVNSAALEKGTLTEPIELALAVQKERQGLGRARVDLPQRPLALIRAGLWPPVDHLPGGEAGKKREQHLLDEPVDAVRHAAHGPGREQKILAELCLLQPTHHAVNGLHRGVLEGG